MSIERHPNINAAGFAVSIVDSYHKYLRGKAKGKEAASKILCDRVVDFVVGISEELDKEFGTEIILQENE